MIETFFRSAMLTALVSAIAMAAPQLNLLQTSLPTVIVNQGSNGTTSVDAKNTGDGSLSLQVTGAAPWLSPAVAASHTCPDASGPGCLPIQIALQTSALSAGNYAGLVLVNDPNAVDAPQTVQVSVQVGSGTPAKFEFWAIMGSSVSSQISISRDYIVTAGNAKWLSVAQSGGSPFSPNLTYAVTMSSGSLAVGDYTSNITVKTSPTVSQNIPVTLHVVKQPLTGPISSVGGALNNTTYAVGEALAQGDIVALFGTQFINGDPAGATKLPLDTTLGGVQLFLNDQPVPLYYVSAGQINFQIPYNAAQGKATLRVESNGTKGNTISVKIAKAVPRILRLGGNFGDYGIIVNPDNTLAIPSSLGGVPVQPGHTIVIYAIGLGPTSPAVDSGIGAPISPLANATDHPQVCFTGDTPFAQALCAAPVFAGLTPNFVGLYQINVSVPLGVPRGDIVPVRLITDDGDSNTVNIAVQE